MKPTVILRLGAGLCFIGHGVLALMAKAKFLLLLSTFNLEPETALSLLKLIGGIDIAIGLLILFRPNRLVIIWAMIWTALTILAWFIHGDSLMDLLRRVPYFTVPYALLVLMYQENRSVAKIEAMNPVKLSDQGEAAIAKIDLTKICMKLQTREGEGWTPIQCEEVALEYRRYLKLKLLYPKERIVPTLAVDVMWHYHILDTAAYEKDCKAIFGGLLHHYPYYGLEGKSDAKNFVNSFDLTKQLYKRTFATLMEGPNYLPSFQLAK